MSERECRPRTRPSRRRRRRDDVGQAEYIIVALDTYLDHRTAYGFGVTASGVRLDRFYPADAEDFDVTFDPVWEARTRVEESGWTAEMWIPLSQLRFNAGDEQVWGVNVLRFVPSNNETDYWVAVPRTEKVWVSRFGELRGVDGVKPARSSRTAALHRRFVDAHRQS